MTAEKPRSNSARHFRSVTGQATKLLPPSGDVDEFAQAVAVERGRPIRIEPFDLGPQEPSGIWLATERCDWLITPVGVGSAQRTAIICHELSHILLGHVPLGADSDLDELVGLVAPHVDASVAKNILARFSYSDGLEAEAEALGTLLVSKLAQNVERHRIAGDAVSDRLR